MDCNFHPSIIRIVSPSSMVPPVSMCAYTPKYGPCCGKYWVNNLGISKATPGPLPWVLSSGSRLIPLQRTVRCNIFIVQYSSQEEDKDDEVADAPEDVERDDAAGTIWSDFPIQLNSSHGCRSGPSITIFGRNRVGLSSGNNVVLLFVPLWNMAADTSRTVAAFTMWTVRVLLVSVFLTPDIVLPNWCWWILSLLLLLLLLLVGVGSLCFVVDGVSAVTHTKSSPDWIEKNWANAVRPTD